MDLARKHKRKYQQLEDAARESHKNVIRAMTNFSNIVKTLPLRESSPEIEKIRRASAEVRQALTVDQRATLRLLDFVMHGDAAGDPEADD